MTVMAGVIVLIKTSPAILSMEIGWVIMFLASQQMHVTSNTIALLLWYCLELFSDSDSDPAMSASANADVNAVAGGLGLHRIQGFMHAENEASCQTVLYVRFREEGMLRWECMIAPGKVGNGIPIRDSNLLGGTSPSQHSIVLSLCVDDWEGGSGTECVGQLIAPWHSCMKPTSHRCRDCHCCCGRPS
jgi:hypothetical protein